MMQRLVLVALAFAPLQAIAQSEVGRFELTPYGAYTFGGTFSDSASDVEASLQDSGSFGLLFNIRESHNTQWEILYSQQNTDTDVEGLSTGDITLDMTVHYLQVGGTYQGDGETVRPYLAATLGASHFDIKDVGYDSDTFFSFSIGPGLQIRPNDRLGLRLEARAFGSFVSSNSNLFCVSDPAGGTASCTITVSGDMLWQLQAMAGVVFRF